MLAAIPRPPPHSEERALLEKLAEKRRKNAERQRIYRARKARQNAGEGKDTILFDLCTYL